MDTSMVFASLVIAAGVAFLVLILAIKMRRDIQESAAGPHSFSGDQSELTKREAGPSTREYGAKDCYVDCMRAFRWESKERGECSEACGLPGA
jgi:hypothetical protein